MTQTREAELMARLEQELKATMEIKNNYQIRLAEVEVLRENMQRKTAELDQRISEFDSLKRRLDKIEEGDRHASFRQYEELDEPQNVVVVKNGEIYQR
jgi:DNA repair ATPase RecN